MFLVDRDGGIFMYHVIATFADGDQVDHLDFLLLTAKTEDAAEGEFAEQPKEKETDHSHFIHQPLLRWTNSNWKYWYWLVCILFLLIKLITWGLVCMLTPVKMVCTHFTVFVCQNISRICQSHADEQKKLFLVTIFHSYHASPLQRPLEPSLFVEIGLWSPKQSQATTFWNWLAWLSTFLCNACHHWWTKIRKSCVCFQLKPEN